MPGPSNHSGCRHLLLSLLVVGVLVLAEPTTKHMTLMLTPQGLTAVRLACPGFVQGVPARVAVMDATASSPLLEVSVAASLCGGGQGRKELLLRRSDITLLAADA